MAFFGRGIKEISTNKKASFFFFYIILLCTNESWEQVRGREGLWKLWKERGGHAAPLWRLLVFILEGLRFNIAQLLNSALQSLKENVSYPLQWKCAFQGGGLQLDIILKKVPYVSRSLEFFVSLISQKCFSRGSFSPVQV